MMCDGEVFDARLLSHVTPQHVQERLASSSIQRHVYFISLIAHASVCGARAKLPAKHSTCSAFFKHWHIAGRSNGSVSSMHVTKHTVMCNQTEAEEASSTDEKVKRFS